MNIAAHNRRRRQEAAAQDEWDNRSDERLEEDDGPAHGIWCECDECADQPILGEED